MRVLMVASELLSAMLGVVGAVVGWKRRGLTRAALPFALEQGVVTVWAASAAAAFADPTHAIWATTELVGFAMSTCSASLFFWFVLAVTRPHRPVTRGVLQAIGGFVAVTLVVTVTEPWAHLVYGSSWRGGRPVEPFGPLYLPLSLVAFALMLTSTAKLVRFIRRGSSADRRAGVLVLSGMLLGMLPTLISLTFQHGQLRRELMPLYLIGSGLLYLTAVLQQGMLGLVPLARHQVLERLSDAVLTLGPDGTVVDANPAAARLLAALNPDDDAATRASVDGLRGRTLPELIPAAGALPDDDGRHQLAVPLPAGGQVDLQITRDPLRDRRGHRVGAVLVARDVTELNDKTARLEESNAQLRQQLETIGALRAELAELAVRDELTGLHNRRYLLTRLDEVIERAGRGGSAVSLVVFDVDHFKRVNDTFGHLAGDRVLRAIADALSESTRRGDVISRHGGEEFVLLLPDCPEPAARQRAEQLRRRIEQIDVPLGDRPQRLTVSAGVATVQPCATTDPGTWTAIGAGLIAAADRALYRAKDAGRNLVLCAEPAA